MAEELEPAPHVDAAYGDAVVQRPEVCDGVEGADLVAWGVAPCSAHSERPALLETLASRPVEFPRILR